MSLPSDMCDDDGVNILENKNLYNHQYLTAIFQINLGKCASSCSNSLDDKAKVLCLSLSDVDDEYLTFGNYSHYVFENLMNQNIENVELYIDKRFVPDRGNLFTNSYRVFDDDANRIAYLFNCYCRIEFVEDFANLILIQDRQKLKRYIVDQAALLLACPYVNVRYTDNPNITPFSDLFQVLTQNIPWPSEYLIYVKKFFVEITNAIYNAKNGITEMEDDYVSSLADLSSDELNLEQIVKPIYEQLCKKFKESHQLAAPFVDDIKFIHILIASPILAELFIDLNSPSNLRTDPTQANSDANPSGQGNSSNSNDLFRSFLMNTLNSLDLPVNNMTTRESGSPNSEKFFQDTLLGILLCNSPLPSPFSKSRDEHRNFFLSVFHGSDYEYQFFASPTTKTPSEIERTELDIDDTLAKLRNSITELFFALLKSSAAVRTKTLKWIECCLVTFNNRSKLWANELLSLVGGNSASNVSDGFVLNFSAILLNLCKPFCSTPDNVASFGIANYDNAIAVNQKMLKVDPIYIGFAKSNVHHDSDLQSYLQILGQESVLINVESNRSNNNMSNEDKEKYNKYEPNFITRCFFSTHKALHLGFRVLHERFNGISQENSQIQRRLDSLGLTSILHYMNRDTLSPSQQDALQRLDHNMTVSLSMKAALIESSFINLLLEFYLATATWINNLAICENEVEATQSFKKLELILSGSMPASLDKSPSQCLHWIPEFIIENIIDFMLFLRTFEVKPKIITLKSDLEPFLTMIVLFMGSQHRMRNPHLRAKMSEMLETLLPIVQVNIQPIYLESLFKKKYFVNELFPALLNVFVSIEISDETNNGDVVAFEQKFNYRRPMYVTFKYLCSLPDHQKTLANLAAYAEHNMDAVQSPIFLRFINLLINDAIYLLDEGLSLMAKLREAQIERDSGAWTRESQQQRAQNEANFTHLGRLAKFHNYIGRDTIIALTTITAHVKSFFSHKVLVDRMASMLNYFLHHLVGPNKRNFRVKQMNEYEFNPGELVKNICRIYVNLACTNPQSVNSSTAYVTPISPVINEKYDEFCLAICQDDRSYSADLLSQAHEILVTKLGQPMLAEDIMSVDRTVKEVMLRQRKREIPLEDIPEEFLDPLLGTLMSDPVILPSSRKVLDRATISRHLLSDHTDPYTRSPLTMDMLVPDEEMKKKIDEFLKSKLKENEQSSELQLD